VSTRKPYWRENGLRKKCKQVGLVVHPAGGAV
jgi:hypothetical protein